MVRSMQQREPQGRGNEIHSAGAMDRKTFKAKTTFDGSIKDAEERLAH
jgi:hypothetical protein